MTDLIKTAPFNEIWEGDKLGRWKDAETIRLFSIKHLDLREKAGLPRTYVLNLDADWGSGKSFFLKGLQKHLRAHGHIAAYVNAWEDDHSEDPFLTVVDAVQFEMEEALPDSEEVKKSLRGKMRTLNSSTARVLGGAVLSGAKHWATKKVGEEAAGTFSEVFFGESGDGDVDKKIGEDAIRVATKAAIDAAGREISSRFHIQRQAQKSFKNQLENLSQEVIEKTSVQRPIFVLIDELDRCRPSYAVELLERVKHIFSLQDFVFVLGTDTKQLSHAVRGVYGQGFDGSRYLKRFIDRTYHFQDIDVGDFVEFMFSRLALDENMFTVPEPYTASRLSAEIFVAGKRSLRDIEQILEQVVTFVAIWPSDKARIDLLTLLVLLHGRQVDVEGDFLNDDFGRSLLEFTKLRHNESPTRNIKAAFTAASAYPEDGGGTKTSSFHSWLADKRIAELNAFDKILSKPPVRLTIAGFYTSLLDRVVHPDDHDQGSSGDVAD